jgi:hypothetical protein
MATQFTGQHTYARFKVFFDLKVRGATEVQPTRQRPAPLGRTNALSMPVLAPNLLTGHTISVRNRQRRELRKGTP